MQAGVNIAVVASGSGAKAPATIHMYVEADLAKKERALNQHPIAQKRSDPISSAGSRVAVSAEPVIVYGFTCIDCRVNIKG